MSFLRDLVLGIVYEHVSDPVKEAMVDTAETAATAGGAVHFCRPQTVRRNARVIERSLDAGIRVRNVVRTYKKFRGKT